MLPLLCTRMSRVLQRCSERVVGAVWSLFVRALNHRWLLASLRSERDGRVGRRNIEHGSVEQQLLKFRVCCDATAIRRKE